MPAVECSVCLACSPYSEYQLENEMEDISLVGSREVAEGSQVLMLKGSHIFFAESGKFAFGPEIYLLQGSEDSEKLEASRNCVHS